MLEVADVENMADYFLLNIYPATWDWPQNNRVGAGSALRRDVDVFMCGMRKVR